MKLFGKDILKQKATEELYDFAQHGLLRISHGYGMDYAIEARLNTLTTNVAAGLESPKEAEPAPEVDPPKTPKELHKLGTLNQPEFEINVHPDYVDQLVAELKFKLEVMGKEKKQKKRKGRQGIQDYLVPVSENAQVVYGRKEVESMIERLQARKKFGEFEKIFGEYVYTTTDAIRQLLADNKHLDAVRAERSIPELPTEAVTAMDNYTKGLDKITGKKPVFYLIREREDESEVQRRRDPILLAQSPFGFFWQILGAWDEEVKFLDEL